MTITHLMINIYNTTFNPTILRYWTGVYLNFEGSVGYNICVYTEDKKGFVFLPNIFSPNLRTCAEGDLLGVLQIAAKLDVRVVICQGC